MRTRSGDGVLTNGRAWSWFSSARAAATVFASVCVGCSPDAVTGVQSAPTRPLFALIACPTGMSSAQCRKFNDGIQHLMRHPDSMCRMLGSNADHRHRVSERTFYQDTYDPNDPENHTPGWSGGLYENGATWYSKYAFYTQPYAPFANVAAHEEYHLAFPYDPAGEQHAAEWGDYCSIGFSN